MGTYENKQLRWTFAIGLSLALHVLIVFLMVGFGGDESTPSPMPASPATAPSPDTAPSPVAVSSPVAASLPVAAPKPELVEPTPNTPPAQPFTIYVVKAGDNLSKIAKLDGSTLAELAELNDTDVKTLSRLQVGQKIKLKNGIE